jgi:hypothetical protein
MTIAASSGRAHRLALTAGIAVLIVDVLYVQFVLFGQGVEPPWPWRVAWVAAWIAVCGGCAIAGGMPQLAPRIRALLLGGASAGLLVMGVVGAWSIGLALLVALGPIAGAAADAARRTQVRAAGMVLTFLAMLLVAALLMWVGLTITG